MSKALNKIIIIFLIISVIFGALPFVIPEYLISTLILFFVWSVVAQSWNLVWGIAGLWSLGQMAIFAMSGYCTGWLIIHFNLSPFLAVVFGILISVFSSLVMALPSIRLQGVYVILMTISFHEIFRILLISDTSGFTGGIFGLPMYEGFVSENFSFSEKIFFQYYIGLLMFIFSTIIIWIVLNSRIGLAFKAIGSEPTYASSKGISIYRTQIKAFLVGGGLAGVAGAYWAQYFGTMQPAVLSYDTMVLVFAMMVVGGWGTFSGPIIGALIMVFVSEFLHAAHQYRLMILGILIIGASVLLPGGLAPQIEKFFNKFFKNKSDLI